MDEEKNEGDIIIHRPQEGETLRKYLQRYTLEERQRIHQNKHKSEEFTAILLDNNWATEEKHRGNEESTQRNLENLWKILERLNNYRRPLHFIEMLEPVRRELLESLDKHAAEMKFISKWCTFGRLLGFTVDSAGTVAGLCLEESTPYYAKWALTAATSFGLVGFASTIAEMKCSANAADDIAKQIEIDKKRAEPIHSWYKQNSKLEEAMLNIFPFDITEKIIKEFTDAEESERFDPVKLLSRLFKAKEAMSMTQRENEELTENLVSFVKCKEAVELCLLLFLRRNHPIYQDIARMLVLLKYSSWPFFACQSVAALAPRDQRCLSIPVLLRTSFNFFSIHDGISSLWNPRLRAGEKELGQLR